MVRDAHDRMALAAVAEGLVGVGRRRPGDGVGGPWFLRLLVVLCSCLPGWSLQNMSYSSQVTSHLPIQKGRIADRVLRPFVVPAALLAFRAAHQEGAAGDGDHVELTLVPGMVSVYALCRAGSIASAVAARLGAAGGSGNAGAEQNQRPVQTGAVTSASSVLISTRVQCCSSESSPRNAPMSKCLSLLRVCWRCCVATARRRAEPKLTRYSFTEPHMGTRFQIIVYAPDEATAEPAAKAAFARIAELNGIMSDYRPTSELMRLCDKAGGDPGQVSAELFFVLDRAQEVSRLSDGAFDVTVGPVVRLWRRRGGQRAARRRELAKAHALVGYENIRLDAKAPHGAAAQAGMQLDLGGIAKGYAADEALAVLKQHGIAAGPGGGRRRHRRQRPAARRRRLEDRHRAAEDPDGEAEDATCC